MQNINIIEISHPSIGNRSSDDCFQLFGQNCLQIVRQNINTAILKHEFKSIPDFLRRNRIASGNINFQWCYHAVKHRCHADSDSRIFGFIHNFHNTFYLKAYAVINRYCYNCINQLLHIFCADIHIFYCRI